MSSAWFWPTRARTCSSWQPSGRTPSCRSCSSLPNHEGPCLDAFRTGSAVVTTNLRAAGGRRPRFAPHAHRGRLPVFARLPAAAACAGDRGAQRLRRDRRRSSGQRRHTPHPGIGRHGIHRATARTRRQTWAGTHRTPNSCEVRSIATRFTTATCGSGCRASWSVSVPYRAGPYPARHRRGVRGVRKGRYPPTRRHRAGGAGRRTVRPSTRWQPFPVVEDAATIGLIGRAP